MPKPSSPFVGYQAHNPKYLKYVSQTPSIMHIQSRMTYKYPATAAQLTLSLTACSLAMPGFKTQNANVQCYPTLCLYASRADSKLIITISEEVVNQADECIPADGACRARR